MVAKLEQFCRKTGIKRLRKHGKISLLPLQGVKYPFSLASF